MSNPHIGSSLDDFLREYELYDECQTEAERRVAEWKATQALPVTYSRLKAALLLRHIWYIDMTIREAIEAYFILHARLNGYNISKTLHDAFVLHAQVWRQIEKEIGSNNA